MPEQGLQAYMPAPLPLPARGVATGTWHQRSACRPEWPFAIQMVQ